MGDFSHLNESGEASMVDVSGKKAASRTARVGSSVVVSEVCLTKLTDDAVLEICTTARIAGIQAAKKTAELIPLCHQINLNKVDVQIVLDRPGHCFEVQATSITSANTGVEMESFVAGSIAALTIYDMIKAVCPEARVEHTRLIEKLGGKLGHWQRVDA